MSSPANSKRRHSLYLPPCFQLVSLSSLISLQWLWMCLRRSLLPYLWHLYLSGDIDSASQRTCLENTETSSHIFALTYFSCFKTVAEMSNRSIYPTVPLAALATLTTLAALASCRTLIHGDDCRIRGLKAVWGLRGEGISKWLDSMQLLCQGTLEGFPCPSRTVKSLMSWPRKMM